MHIALKQHMPHQRRVFQFIDEAVGAAPFASFLQAENILIQNRIGQFGRAIIGARLGRGQPVIGRCVSDKAISGQTCREQE